MGDCWLMLRDGSPKRNCQGSRVCHRNSIKRSRSLAPSHRVAVNFHRSPTPQNRNKKNKISGFEQDLVQDFVSDFVGVFNLISLQSREIFGGSLGKNLSN